MNGQLMTSGILLVAGLFIFTNFVLSAKDKTQIDQVKNICNFNPILGIPNYNSSTPNATSCTEFNYTQSECQSLCQEYVSFPKLLYPIIITWEPEIYILGGVCILIGLLTGGPKKERVEVIREIIHEPSPQEKPQEPPPYEPPTF